MSYFGPNNGSGGDKISVNSKISLSNISYYVMCVLSMLFISLGLMSDYSFWNVATYGPIVLIGIGVLLITISFELNHQFSKRLDSLIFRIIRVKEIETRWFSFLVTMILFSFASVFALFSIHSISVSSALYFAITVFLSAIFVGISLARVFTSLRGNQYSMHTHSAKQLEIEHKQLSDFLLGSNVLEKQYKTRIFNQSELISENVGRLLSDNPYKFMNDVNQIVHITDDLDKLDYPRIANSILSIGEIANSKTIENWTRYSLNSYYQSIRFNPEAKICFNKLSSHLLLKPLRIILEFYFSENTDIHDFEISDKLLVLLSETAYNTGNDNLFSSDLNRYSSIVKLGKSENEKYAKYYVHEVGYSSDTNREGLTSKWNPWWLISLRIRLSILQERHDWEDSTSFLEREKCQSSLPYVTLCKRTHKVLSNLLSRTEVYPDNAQDVTKMISSRYSELYNGEQIPVKFLNELNKKAQNSGSINDRLIRRSYIIFKEIHNLNNEG